MQSNRIRRTINQRKDLKDGVHEMGNWSLHKEHVDARWTIYRVYHYTTQMLVWYDSKDVVKITHHGFGHGSATDQQIVNAILEELHVDLYFSRKGGSHYVTLDHKDVPTYRRKVLA